MAQYYCFPHYFILTGVTRTVLFYVIVLLFYSIWKLNHIIVTLIFLL